MRELKFRAYHQDYGMIHSDEYFLLGDAVDGMLDFFGGPSKDFKSRNFTFMQFTGLRDKHGRDVYEGDILSNGTVVVWNEKCAAFGCHDTHPMRDMIFLVDDELLAEVEVIGNIYEHPDLLPH